MARATNVFKTQGSNTNSLNFPVGNKTFGDFGIDETGYVGFRVRANESENLFGWMRVRVSGDGQGRPTGLEFVPLDGTNIYGAFNSTPDGTINAGDVLAAVPEPANVAAGLALFALGAVGVREFRRRRQLAA